MKQTFELINATPHDIQLNRASLPPYLSDRRGNPKGLRTQETGSQEPIGRFQTDMGPIDIYEKEYAGLTDESREDFQQIIDTVRQQNTETLGRRVAHIVIGSPLAVFGAAMSGFEVNPMQTDVSMGWPALMQRHGRSLPHAARRVGVLPVRPSSHPSIDHGELALRRQDLFRQTETNPLHVTNRSPDPLTFGNRRVLQKPVIEPLYHSDEIGIGMPGSVEVARERLNVVSQVPRIEIGSLTIVHSRALLALMLTSHATDPESAAHIVMPATSRSKKTNFKTPAIGSVAVYGKQTLDRIASVF